MLVDECRCQARMAHPVPDHGRRDSPPRPSGAYEPAVRRLRTRVAREPEDSSRVPVRCLRTRGPCRPECREEHSKGGTRPASLWNEHLARTRGLGAGTHRSGLGRRRNPLPFREGWMSTACSGADHESRSLSYVYRKSAVKLRRSGRRYKACLAM